MVLNELKETATLPHDTGLGEVGRAEICQELSQLTGKKWKPQIKYSDQDTYTIAKYSKDNGVSQAANFFKNKYPTINEFIVQTFVKKYDENVKVSKVCGRSPDRELKNLMCRRPLMVRPIIDEKVRKLMVSLCKKGSHASRSIAATTAMLLLSRTDDESAKNVVVATTWGKSLLQRIRFQRRALTTSKVKVPDSAKCLVINSDQTPSKYVQVGRFIMAPKSAKKVGVA